MQSNKGITFETPFWAIS